MNVTEALADYKKHEVYRIMFNWELAEYAKLFKNMYTPFKGHMFPTGEYYIVRDKNTKCVYGGFEVITDAVVADRLYMGPASLYLFNNFNLSKELRDLGVVYIAETATTLAGKGKGVMSSVIDHLIRKGVKMFIYPTHNKMVKQCEESGLTAVQNASNILADEFPNMYTNVVEVFEQCEDDMILNDEYAPYVGKEVKVAAILWHRTYVHRGLTAVQQCNYENLVIGNYGLRDIIDYTGVGYPE